MTATNFLEQFLKVFHSDVSERPRVFEFGDGLHEAIHGDYDAEKSKEKKKC